MIDVRRIALSPWDFTLYQSDQGAFVLKVIFSEGDYKTDVGRFFLIDSSEGSGKSIDELKELSARIRYEYPQVSYTQIQKGDIRIST